MKFVALFAAVLCLLSDTSGFAGESAIRHFALVYQDQAFTVPKGEEWRLSWKSPYKAGDVTPAYDVRIEKGSALIGENKAVQAAPFSTRDDGSLDINATNKPAVIWLEAGTKFETANDLLKIQVTVYKTAN